MNKLPPKRPNEEPSNFGSRRLRLPSEPSCPSLSKVKSLLEEAQGKRGTLVEMPWPDSPYKTFILTCQWDESLKDPVWTLYEEIEGNSKVVWTQPFAPQDLEFLYDILSMSAGSSAKLEIPDELKPKNQAEESFADVDLGGMPGGVPGGIGMPSGGPALTPSLGSGMGGGMGGGMGVLGGGMAPIVPLNPMQPAAASQGANQQGYPQNPLYAQPPDANSYTNVPVVQPGGSYPGMQPNTPYQYPPQQMQQPMPQQMQQHMQQQHQMPMMPQGQPGIQGYPPNSPYPQQQQQPLNYGQSMPPQMPQQMQQQYPQSSPSYTQEMMEPKIPLDYHLMDKRANILLGTMLKEAGLISDPTLEAALKLQELVRDEKMSVDKAPEVLKRLHAMGSSIDQYLTKGDFDKSAGAAAYAAAPKPAAPASKPIPQSGQGQGQPGQGRDLKGAFDILQKAQLLTESDLTTAMNVRKKHGGDIVQILEAAGKVNSKTVDAAVTSLPLIREGLMKIEQVIMALNYCERMRVSFDDALEEMGWQNPRKLRTDLPL
ncbi:MAG: hypothetical protein Q8T09_18830 [Candidatus Melainabacteria bacterium]|nr:hypothetical protein [Candidatus Melainabacteria bacterium]